MSAIHIVAGRTVEDIARDFVAWHSGARTLRTKRADLFCKNEGGPEERPGLPCWKGEVRSGGGYGGEPYMANKPKADWCPTCLERDKVNKAFRQAMAKRGAYLRALIQAVNRC